MTWRLVDDVWGLILLELSGVEMSRLTRVHSYFWRLLNRNLRYRRARIFSTPDSGSQYLRACGLGDWDLLPEITGVRDQIQYECFREYYPISLTHQWPRLHISTQHRILLQAWIDCRLDLANELANLITISAEGFTWHNKFLISCRDNYEIILPLVPTMNLELVECFFMGICRFGKVDRAQAIYSLRPEMSLKTIKRALSNSCGPCQRPMIRWLISIYPPFRWQDFIYGNIKGGSRTILIQADPRVPPDQRHLAWREYSDYYRGTGRTDTDPD